MAATNLIFYPQHYIGFNKVALLERQLCAAGFLTHTLTQSSYYLPGRYFNHFIARHSGSQIYAVGLIRVHLQAVGLWFNPSANSRLMERTNLVIVEANMVNMADSYQYLIDLLLRITGDEYCCQSLPDYPMSAIEDGQRARFA